MATTQVTKRFRPSAVGEYDNWTLAKGTNKALAVDPGEPIVHDDSGTFIRSNAALGQSYTIDRDFQDSMGTINAVRIHCRYDKRLSTSDRVQATVRLTTTWVVSSGINNGSGDYAEASVAVSRPGGGGWTESDLRDTSFNFGVIASSGSVDVTSLWPEVDYLPTDESGGAIPPEFPARKLRRSRFPIGLLQSKLRGDVLDIDLMEEFEVQHSKGIDASGDGWISTKPKKFRLINQDLDLNTLECDIKAIDIEDYGCSYWNTWASPYTVESGDFYEDGPANLHPGITDLTSDFRIASVAHYVDGSNRCAVLSGDKKRLTPVGLVLEGQSQNDLKNASFFAALTTSLDWIRQSTKQTRVSTGLFHYDEVFDTLATGDVSATSNAVLKLTSGFISQVIDHGNTQGHYHNFSIWTKDNDTTKPIRFMIRTTAVPKEYLTTSGAWQSTCSIIPVSGDTDWHRNSTDFLVNLSSGTGQYLEYRIYAPLTTGTGFVGQVQSETLRHLLPTTDAYLGQQGGTTPIPRSQNTQTRFGEVLKLSNPVGRRIWPKKAGTFSLRIRPGWVSAVNFNTVSSEQGALPILLVRHNETNWAYLGFYNDQFRFTINAGGTQQTAVSCALGLPDGILDYDIACRWTSTNAELGLSARTLSLFVNGNKGTDATHSAYIVEVDSTSYLFMGDLSKRSSVVSTATDATIFGGNSIVAEPNISVSRMEIVPWAKTCGAINQMTTQ